MRSAFLLSLALVGCTTARNAAEPMVRARAASDLACPDRQITIKSRSFGRYEARGCGKTASYGSACEALSCTVWREGEEAPAWRDRPDPGTLESER